MKLLSYPANIRVLLSQHRALLNPQCRNLHLLQAAKTRSNINPEIKDFVPLEYYARPARVVVNLCIGEHRPIIHRLSLQQILETQIKPNHILVPYQSPTTNELIPGTYIMKNITPVRLIGGHKLHFTKERKSRAKELHFNSKTTPIDLINAMKDAWMWMKEGYPIEIQIHRGGAKSQLHFSKMINKCIHLRPDVLLKAMPRKSGMIIVPQTNHQKACWVIGPAVVNKEEKLEIPFNRTHEFYKTRREQLALGGVPLDGHGKIQTGLH